MRNYRADVSPVEEKAAAMEIEGLLSQSESDAALADRLQREFGCNYDPRPDLGGPSLREWLVQIAVELRK